MPRVKWQTVDVDGGVGTTPVTARVPDEGTSLLLVRDDQGRLHATALACPHLGQPLADARVDGDVLECSHHAYRYRLADGRCVGPGDGGGTEDGVRVGDLVVHEVREGPDGIQVRLATSQ